MWCKGESQQLDKSQLIEKTALYALERLEGGDRGIGGFGKEVL